MNVFEPFTKQIDIQKLPDHSATMPNEKKKFVEQAAPEYWFSYAIELAEIADSVYARSKNSWFVDIHRYADGSEKTQGRPVVSRPVLLLYGISIENLIKGILISEDTSRLQEGMLNKHLLGHDLSKLADRLKTIQLTASEVGTLSLLSNIVPYHGRYPVPRNSEDLKPEEHINEEIYRGCTALFERLSIELYRLNYFGIDAPEGVRFPKIRLPHLDDKMGFDTRPPENFLGEDI